MGMVFTEILNQLKEFEKNSMRLNILLRLLFDLLFLLKFEKLNRIVLSTIYLLLSLMNFSKR